MALPRGVHHSYAAAAVGPRITMAQLMAEVSARRAAEQAMADAVHVLAMAEVRTPCCDSEVNDVRLWTSERPDDRALACVLCGPCPVRVECAAYGATLPKDERWCLWWP